VKAGTDTWLTRRTLCRAAARRSGTVQLVRRRIALVFAPPIVRTSENTPSRRFSE
jgi:hypothetical protein